MVWWLPPLKKSASWFKPGIRLVGVLVGWLEPLCVELLRSPSICEGFLPGSSHSPKMRQFGQLVALNCTKGSMSECNVAL